jgi:hypothetical protein
MKRFLAWRRGSTGAPPAGTTDDDSDADVADAADEAATPFPLKSASHAPPKVGLGNAGSSGAVPSSRRDGNAGLGGVDGAGGVSGGVSGHTDDTGSKRGSDVSDSLDYYLDSSVESEPTAGSRAAVTRRASKGSLVGDSHSPTADTLDSGSPVPSKSSFVDVEKGGALLDCAVADEDGDNEAAMAELERQRHFESKVVLRMQLRALRKQVDALCTDRMQLQKTVQELRTELIRIQTASPLRPSDKDPNPTQRLQSELSMAKVQLANATWELESRVRAARFEWGVIRRHAGHHLHCHALYCILMSCCTHGSRRLRC